MVALLRNSALEAFIQAMHRNRSGDRGSLPFGHKSASAAKSSFEAGEVAILGGCEESLKESPLLSRIRWRLSAVSDTLASAVHHLPRVGLFKPEGVRDVAVCVVERLPKNVSGSFRGRQLLQQ